MSFCFHTQKQFSSDEAALICVVNVGALYLTPVCSSGQSAFFSDPDEEIDFLQSVIDKQEVTALRPVTSPGERAQNITSCLSLWGRPPQRLLLLSAAVAPPRNDAEKTRIDASLHAMKSQSGDAPRANTAAPLPDTTTPQPRNTSAVGRGGPDIAPTHRKDELLISEWAQRSTPDRRGASQLMLDSPHLPLLPLLQSSSRCVWCSPPPPSL